ncbi:nucleoside triphosphate pyrophosphohydrolase [Novosphingobium sp. 9]|uniref:nucleoside triphosphate pyrophosphohydrolase n=1 Tax=Novosphingobium sp. 9 TaxID=2025349 RepID=UPI0021B5C3A3|nr:nucleoside triphosphate pyrophosphohydrolase [Novosphingobium sp. 9]
MAATNRTPDQELARLLAIMVRLRHPETGCEWDREQTFATIAPYTIEEAYEVAEAIAHDDLISLRDELGDLLFQVVFHARMAEERGAFAFADVAAAISHKMERRHPHIFGDVNDQLDVEGIHRRWEEIKASEREAKGETSAIDGVAVTLPALMRAEKLQKRAARVGFDWPEPHSAAAKVAEEVAELAEASPEEKLEEAGDLLFAAVNLVRLNGIAPEDALRAANAKFERRFRSMEQFASEDGHDFAILTLDEQEQYWQAVKRSERTVTA